MDVKNIHTIPCMSFPCGRKTHVMVGENGAVRSLSFAQGYVEIESGGEIKEHSHENIESYTVLSGSGKITIDGEEKVLNEGDYVLIESNRKHSFINHTDKKATLMFVYAPGTIVDHWDQEMKGLI